MKTASSNILTPKGFIFPSHLLKISAEIPWKAWQNLVANDFPAEFKSSLYFKYNFHAQEEHSPCLPPQHSAATSHQEPALVRGHSRAEGRGRTRPAWDPPWLTGAVPQFWITSCCCYGTEHSKQTHKYWRCCWSRARLQQGWEPTDGWCACHTALAPAPCPGCSRLYGGSVSPRSRSPRPSSRGDTGGDTRAVAGGDNREGALSARLPLLFFPFPPLPTPSPERVRRRSEALLGLAVRFLL